MEGASEQMCFIFLFLLHHLQAKDIHWSWDFRPWKQEVEDIWDYTLLPKDVHLSDLHSLRLADNIISLVKWVFLLMVCELYTRWLNAASKIKLFQVLQLSEYWLAPAPVLKANRWSLATQQDGLPGECTVVIAIPKSVLILARNHMTLTGEMSPLLGNRNKTME